MLLLPGEYILLTEAPRTSRRSNHQDPHRPLLLCDLPGPNNEGTVVLQDAGQHAGPVLYGTGCTSR